MANEWIILRDGSVGFDSDYLSEMIVELLNARPVGAVKAVLDQPDAKLDYARAKLAFDRIIDPKNASVARSFFGDVATVSAPDDSTVVFDLKPMSLEDELALHESHQHAGVGSAAAG